MEHIQLKTLFFTLGNSEHINSVFVRVFACL